LAYTLDTELNRETIHESISSIVGAGNILPAHEINAYSVDGKIPRVVAFPQDANALSNLLKFATKTGLSVIPRGSGTKMNLGGIPKTADIVLSLLKLNRLVEYEPDDLVVTVQAGLKLADLQRTLAQKRQHLPIDPPYGDETTVGGMVASNSSGPLRHRFGTCRDLVLGVRVVHPSGVSTKAGGKVVKNVAGYDVRKLHIGAFGTLGVITELTFKLSPLPESEKTFAASFDRLDRLADLTRQISRSDLVPSALEVLNNGAAMLVAEETNDLFNQADHVLVADFRDVQESVTRELSIIARFAESSGASKTNTLEGVAQESLWHAIRNLPGLFGARHQVFVSFKVNVPIAETLHAYDKLQHYAAEKGFTSVTSSHVEDGIIHLCLSPDKGTQPIVAKELPRLVAVARDMVFKMNGTLVVEKCPISTKEMIDVWGTTNNLNLMRAVKSLFDPEHVLNPGRYVGGI
jgi:glycolate oxidase FAD binding subunit